MRRIVLLLLALAALLGGCGKNATAPPPGSGGSANVPLIIATNPPARAASAPYDAEIWAQFDRPLDERTVSALSVYLKLDGQRIPSVVSYDGITRRVFVRPTVVLELQRTYTVEFSTSVHATDGAALPPGVFFQFTTNSLRRIAYDYPATGSQQGPVVAFGWGGTQGPTGNILYEVYAGTDSAAVAVRTGAYLQRHPFTRFLPATRWPAGTRVFWAVTSENQTTHERENGLVQSFDVYPATTPLDSLVIRTADFGSTDVRVRNSQFCNTQNMPCGPSYNAAMHWAVGALPLGVSVESVSLRVVLQDSLAGRWSRSQPTAWMSQNDWTGPCAILSPGPPFNEVSGLLSGSVEVDPLNLEFRDDRLASFVEAQARKRTLVPGLVMRASSNVIFHSPNVSTPELQPQMLVRFYRPGP